MGPGDTHHYTLIMARGSGTRDLPGTGGVAEATLKWGEVRGSEGQKSHSGVHRQRSDGVLRLARYFRKICTKNGWTVYIDCLPMLRNGEAVAPIACSVPPPMLPGPCSQKTFQLWSSSSCHEVSSTEYLESWYSSPSLRHHGCSSSLSSDWWSSRALLATGAERLVKDLTRSTVQSSASLSSGASVHQTYDSLSTQTC